MQSPHDLTFFEYRKVFLTQLWTDVRGDLKGLVLAIAPAIVVAVLQAKYGLIPTEKAWTSAAVNGMPYAALLALFVAYHAIRAPWKLARSADATTKTECLALNKQIQKLTPPKRTAVEEHSYAKAQAALAGFGELRPEMEKALRHLNAHTELIFSGGPLTASVPEGMIVRDLKCYLNLCVDKSLAIRTLGTNRSGGAYPVHDEVYSIVPGMKSALEELLYPVVTLGPV